MYFLYTLRWYDKVRLSLRRQVIDNKQLSGPIP